MTSTLKAGFSVSRLDKTEPAVPPENQVQREGEVNEKLKFNEYEPPTMIKSQLRSGISRMES
jgi:hypothetical protein